MELLCVASPGWNSQSPGSCFFKQELGLAFYFLFIFYFLELDSDHIYLFFPFLNRVLGKPRLYFHKPTS